MKKPTHRTAELDDTDIASLFDQQSLEPPASIDDAVLAAAQNALDEQSGGMVAVPVTVQRGTGKWYQLAAAAAVLVLAVTLVPTMIQSPEYRRESSPAVSIESIPVEQLSPASIATSASEFQADDAFEGDTIERSRILRKKLIDADSAVSTRAAVQTQRRAAARVAKEDKVQVFSQRTEPARLLEATPASSDEEQSANSRVVKPATSAVGMGRSELRPLAAPENPLAAETNDEVTSIDSEKRLLIHAQETYRQSPQKWADEIVRLHKADDLEDAEREYALFKLMYPELADDPRLPEELRESDE